MNAPPFAAVVCTKDRPRELRRVLRGISDSLAISGGRGRVVVVDDSRSARNRLAGHASELSSSVLRTTVVGPDEAAELFAVAGVADLLERGPGGTLRTLGCGPWSPAGARNVAFLLGAAVSRRQPELLFLDDDIVFGSHPAVWPSRRALEADPLPRALAAMRGALGGRASAAAGVRYLGCVDVSFHEHVQLLLGDYHKRTRPRRAASAQAQVLQAAPQRLPIVAVGGFSEARRRLAEAGPGEVSGATMLVRTRALLETPPQPPVYNEDWIWLAAAHARGWAVTRSRATVLHLPSLDKRLTGGAIYRQEFGEAVFAAASGWLAATGRSSLNLAQRLDATPIANFTANALSEQVVRLRRLCRRLDRATQVAEGDDVVAGLSALHELFKAAADRLDAHAADAVAAVVLEWAAAEAPWRAACGRLARRGPQASPALPAL